MIQSFDKSDWAFGQNWYDGEQNWYLTILILYLLKLYIMTSGPKKSWQPSILERKKVGITMMCINF
jgi:hypothetical protein